ncbi:ribose-phosphate diphosphokinase [Mucispirillum schaedleri]|jgi:ribose-phosphate pyrophosphokinase|uniref:Ribose-phosphate pyrophosphokinase n=1 Tax=Mucispirillum schaedleri ASF457 TaxID=1379858 RepID=V2QID9_9BACT|nr:ribose-phosphate pyrophosphokinase [Mucispirillum schaedleri]MCX4359955.1 ribose-phosphate pyrophosphokinase [Mucispirillum schaedleri]USF23821.1 Ribose-phosphate pyrophosphokinase [Mucispirillum schaedleri ASF457]SIW06756.1 phosphoribosylpyrophosphate synthase [Mucispirillum schaedleri ASF457]
MDFLIFSGNSNKSLAESIVSRLGMRLGAATVSKFSDGEIMVKIDESVRGRDVFVVQPTNAPSDSNLMELMVMTDALKRASANTITAIMPYFGYSRQDRASEPRVPITAKLVSNLIATSGVDRVVTMDLHAGQIQGFFDIPVDNLYALPVFYKYMQDNNLCNDDTVIVSPDAGGVARARIYAKKFGMPLAIIDKRRSGPNVAKVMHVIGEIAGKKCILIDDMIDTAGTLTEAAVALMEHGAVSVKAMATHGILSGPAIDRISSSVIEKVIITDTIDNTRLKDFTKLQILSVAGILATSIERIHNKESISSLFTGN